LIKLSETYNSFQLASDFIKVPKVISNADGKKFNVATGTEISKADYAHMMKKGDFNLFDAYYYKKVYTTLKDEFGNPIPLSKLNAKLDREYFYKLINVYGDGSKAVEMNTNFTPSVIDNGSLRIPNEVSDEQIVSMINPGIEKEIVSLPIETPAEVVSEEVITEPTEPGEQLGLFEDKLTLKDGKEYNKTDVNSNMLEAMGYTPKEIGKILKSIC
jgi:hypothetical protein